MHKFTKLIERSYIKSLTYRSEVFLWLILDLLPLFVMMLVWINIYQHQTSVAGYTLSTILFYYFLTAVINGVTGSHFETWRVQEIREGKIDFYLTRPLTYLTELLLRDIGGKFFYLTISLPIFMLFGLFLFLFANVSFPLPTLSNLFIFFLLLLSTYLIEFSLAALIVMYGFWNEHSEGLEHFKWIVITLVSGLMIPFAMMPIWLRNIVNFLPFKYMYAIPIGVIQDTYTVTPFDVIYILGFLFALLLTVRFVWQRAQYQYSSQGG